MNFLAVLDAFAQAKSTQGIDELLNLYLSKQGITGYSFSYYGRTRNRDHKLRYEMASERMKIWHCYYHEEDHAETDTTHQSVNRTLLPLFWDTAEQLKNAKTEKERKMRQESIEFGVTQGLCIPLHGPQGDFAELTLRQFISEDCLENWAVKQSEWYLVALAYFNAVRELLLINATAETSLLTKREQQCLNLLAENYSLADIAKKLEMTERTVNFHIQNLNFKLKVRNKYEAVVKARQLGIIKI